MGTRKSDWERVSEEPLGEGGQSKVFVVRTPDRTRQRARSLETINGYAPTGMGQKESISRSNLEYLQAIRDYIRSDDTEELGAMKEFKLRDDEVQSLRRLEQEIEILRQGRPGLPKLLGANLEERWMVTEYFTNRTVEDHLPEYKGNAASALKAFRSVVHTVSLLHKDDLVHRDIKPANIFVGMGHELFLGDFGLVYVPNRAPRITRFEGETVGAGDFIPPATWRGLGVRLEGVKPNFDVYMLGKVLWCMVAGKPKLDREFWDEPDNDVTKLFPHDPHMHMVNDILGHSVVQREQNCLASADDLLLVVDTHLESIKQGGQLLRAGVPRICRVCGVGRYARQALTPNIPSYNMRLWESGTTHPQSMLGIEIWECGTCHHVQFFRTAPRP
jgi:serine/threonine protein kinase